MHTSPLARIRAGRRLPLLALLLPLLFVACAGDAEPEVHASTVTPATASPAVGETAAPTPTQPPCEDIRYDAVEGAPMPVSSPAPFVADRELQDRLEEATEPHEDAISIVALHVESRRFAAVDPQREHYAASLFKLPQLIEGAWLIAQGALDPAEEYTLHCPYAAEDLGTLEALALGPGDALPLSEALRLMTVASDNALATLIGDVVGREAADRDAARLGATRTSVSVAALPTSALDMARLLDAVARGEPSPASAAYVFETLSEQWFRSRIPAGVPDDGSVVGNKTGDWVDAAHDVALVRAPFGDYVLAMLTDGSVPDEHFAELAALVHAAFAGEPREVGPTPAAGVTP